MRYYDFLFINSNNKEYYIFITYKKYKLVVKYAIVSYNY